MKPTIIAIVISGAFIVSAVILAQNKTTPPDDLPPENNVTIEEGTQVVSIFAKGGYFPRLSKAKADMPTTLRVETTGTFDCSSALTIPTLKYQTNLPPSGVTDIPLLPQKAGTILEGLCTMGMYGFAIAFE